MYYSYEGSIPTQKIDRRAEDEKLMQLIFWRTEAKKEADNTPSLYRILLLGNF